MKTQFNILEVGLICIVFTFMLKEGWFTDPMPDDKKWSGFTGWSAMKYELRSGHFDKSGIQIGAWIKFIFSVCLWWLWMFSVSCLPLVLGKRVIGLVRSRLLDKRVKTNE